MSEQEYLNFVSFYEAVHNIAHSKRCLPVRRVVAQLQRLSMIFSLISWGSAGGMHRLRLETTARADIEREVDGSKRVGGGKR